MRRIAVIVMSLSVVGFVGCKKSEETQTSKTEGTFETVNPAVAATISGKIKFEGTAPKPKMIAVSADNYCSKQHDKAQIASEEVVVNSNKTLKNVLVYIKKGLEGKKFAPIKEPVVLNQHGCWYEPHVIGVMVNQPLLVRNDDDTLHNIHAMPKINSGFNFAQPAKGMESTKTFDKEEVGIPIKCDVHSWMGGYIGVLAHPYFAITGQDGSFSLKNLPPGEYEVQAWHEKYGVQTQTVKVGEKESKTVDFTFKPASM